MHDRTIGFVHLQSLLQHLVAIAAPDGNGTIGDVTRSEIVFLLVLDVG